MIEFALSLINVLHCDKTTSHYNTAHTQHSDEQAGIQGTLTIVFLNLSTDYG